MGAFPVRVLGPQLQAGKHTLCHTVKYLSLVERLTKPGTAFS
jgi:hypothetical protein